MSSRTWTVSFTVGAVEQAQVVNDWWERERPSAPGLFFEELTSAIERLTSMPGAGAAFDSACVPAVRRILLPKCAYHLYYTLDPKQREVVVRAVWHSARGSGPELG